MLLRSLRLIGVGLRHVAFVGSHATIASLQARRASAAWSGYVVSHVVAPIDDDVLSLEILATAPLDEIWVMLPLGYARPCRTPCMPCATVQRRFVWSPFANLAFEQPWRDRGDGRADVRRLRLKHCLN
jgi:hypothetical protein